MPGTREESPPVAPSASTFSWSPSSGGTRPVSRGRPPPPARGEFPGRLHASRGALALGAQGGIAPGRHDRGPCGRKPPNRSPWAFRPGFDTLTLRPPSPGGPGGGPGPLVPTLLGLLVLAASVLVGPYPWGLRELEGEVQQ